MAQPNAPVIRFRVEPGDVPIEKAARRLHLTEAQFREKIPRLLARGFPMPDPDTGMFDLEAIDRWRHNRHPHLFSELAGPQAPAEPKVDLGRKFVEGFDAAQRERAARKRRRVTPAS